MDVHARASACTGTTRGTSFSGIKLLRLLVLECVAEGYLSGETQPAQDDGVVLNSYMLLCAYFLVAGARIDDRTRMDP